MGATAVGFDFAAFAAACAGNALPFCVPDVIHGVGKSLFPQRFCGRDTVWVFDGCGLCLHVLCFVWGYLLQATWETFRAPDP